MDIHSYRPWWITPLIITTTALVASFLTSVAIGAMQEWQYQQSLAQQDDDRFAQEAAMFLNNDPDEE